MAGELIAFHSKTANTGDVFCNFEDKNRLRV